MVRKLLILPPILVGLAFLLFMASGREGPERRPAAESARAVRVITVQPTDFVPRAIGFGSVYPGKVWNATAQVGGEVVYTHPQLKKGGILPAGTEIARIAPDDFQLAIRQAEANIRSAEAKLAEFEVTEKNTTDLLAIEQRGLDLRNSELARKRDLLRRGAVARAAFELEQREALAQRKKVQDLKNTLRLLPTQRAVQQEQIAVYGSQLASAQLNLERTRIVLPFDARIASVSVEEKQFVQVGGALATADSVDIAEVDAQMPIAQFRAMVRASVPGGLPGGFTPQSFSAAIRSFGFSATVRLRTGNDLIEWPARFARVSDTVDPKTRTIGAIVAVDGAYAKAVPGERPPLTKGMFVEIEIRTPARKNAVVIPRSALHDGAVHVVDTKSRLAIRPVTVAVSQDDFAVVEKGLAGGERVVVSDLVPAVPGMLLKPVDDTDAMAALKAQAAGRLAPR